MAEFACFGRVNRIGNIFVHLHVVRFRHGAGVQWTDDPVEDSSWLEVRRETALH
jgi:hypothetical protein